jgi:hypothetical protein
LRGIAKLAAALALALVLPAHAEKVLRYAFLIAETGFDPQATSDYYSSHVERAIFEPLYTFDYLARPSKVIPNIAAAMPDISADGRTWTIRIRPGVYFTDDPAFKGQRRELTAADYIYSWKRVLDPRTRSPNLQTFDDLFVGADALVANASVDGLFDYDTPIDGLQALDAHTDLVAERAHLTGRQHILDVGCGLGAPAVRIAERYGCEITAVNISREQIRQGRELMEQRQMSDRVRIVRGDARALDFPDGSFDGIITKFVKSITG